MEHEVKNYAFFKALCDLKFVEQIILYGSRARGDNQPRSDIDLGIVAPKASRNDWISVLEIVDQADTLLGIDCVRVDELKSGDPLLESIQRDGVSLFKR